MFNKKRFIRRIYDSESDSDDQIAENRVDVENSNGTSINKDVNASSDDDGTITGTGSASDEESNFSFDNDTSNSTVGSSQPLSNPTPNADATPQENQNQASTQRADADRIDRIERMIANINDFMNRFETRPIPDNDAEKSWKVSNDVNRHESGGNSSSNIRWDYLKPFPSGIPANKMWEHWNRYVENFEIATSLSNVSDPAKRTQLLYLGNMVMGNG